MTNSGLRCKLACFLLAFSMPQVAFSAAGELRGLEEKQQEIESRFEVIVSMDLAFSAVAPFPDMVVMTCGEGTEVILLVKDSLGWISADDCTATGNILRCSNFLKKTVTYEGVFVTHEARLVIACRGLSNAANSNGLFDYLQVTLPQAIFSSSSTLEYTFVPGYVVRSIGVNRICDLPRVDGTFPSDSYWMLPQTELFPTCPGDDVGDMFGDNYLVCEITNSCPWENVCEDILLPKMTRTADVIENPVFECIFSTTPEPLPTLDTTYRADYVMAHVITDFGCTFDAGTITITCQNGGRIASTDDQNTEVCQFTNDSTVVCDANFFNIVEGSSFSCTGSSLEELAIASIWNPGSIASLVCNGEKISFLHRTLNMFQKCPPLVQALRSTYFGYADDLAVSCYPLSSTFYDILVINDVTYYYEVCAAIDGECYPNCSTGYQFSRQQAEILPQHIDKACLTITSAIDNPDNAPALDSVPALFGDVPNAEPNCFSSESWSMVEGKGEVAMKDIEVGDRVLTASRQYKAVYSVDHVHSTRPTHFVQIHHIMSNKTAPLELTSRHMLFVVDRNKNKQSLSKRAVPASQIEVGDFISHTLYGPVEVTKVESITRNGLYNVLTEDGTIVVNGIVASAYASFSGTVNLEIGGYKIISQQTFLGLLLMPYRNFCMGVSLKLCKRNKEMVWYDRLGLYVLDFWVKQNSMVQGLVFLVILLIVSILGLVLNPVGMAILAVFFSYFAVVANKKKISENLNTIKK